MASRKKNLPEIVTDPGDSAKLAGLRYVSDQLPGIQRKKSGKGFRYIHPDGKPVTDPQTLSRIRSLVIPPAWTEVWICPFVNGHLQAVGRDSKRRKQYRYHARWKEIRDETKFTRMILFGHALPQIRERVEQDLALPKLPKEKVLAAVVRLLETTMIRVGNEEYMKEHKSYGLTTMRNHHVQVNGSEMKFQFRGKGGKYLTIGIEDRRLARIVKRCQDIPGYELFQYLDETGEIRSIDSSDVNAYLREISGEDFTAKDFRTWAATILAALAVQELQSYHSKTQAKRNIVRAIQTVAKKLGNTPAICRKCYIHPAIIDGYLDGTILVALTEKRGPSELLPEEAAVLAFLEERLEQAA